MGARGQCARRCDAASTKDMEQSVYHLTPFSRVVAWHRWKSSAEKIAGVSLCHTTAPRQFFTVAGD